MNRAAKRSRHASSRAKVSRRGSVLLVVLVVVALLSLGAYTFSEMMITEKEGSAMYGRAVHTRTFADSGIEMAASLLGDPKDIVAENYYHNPEMFHGILMRDATSPRGRGRFSLLAPVESDQAAGSIRFGLIDESSRLNLNSLMKMGVDDPELLRERLMYLPEMTYEVADAILDWLDEDLDMREYGAESDYYTTLDPPYVAADGPFESLDELLLVAGVTPWLLYGEDANRNGLLDANENDGDQTPPFDNADGVLQLGWSAFLTVHSRESNINAEGEPRIDVNNNTLTDLYDQLEETLGTEHATFVVAYRMNGAYGEEEETDPTSSGQESGTGQQASAQSGNSGGSSGAGGGGGAQQLAQGLGQALFSAGGGGSVTRGGMELSGGAKVTVNSLYDLVGRQVQVDIEGRQTILESPWSADASDMQSYLPQLLDLLSTKTDPFIEGRLNINQTRQELLLGIPDMTEELAANIASSQMIGSGGEPLTDVMQTRATTGWLVMQGLVDLPLMRKLDPYLTTRGDVFRVQSLGYFDAGGPFTRLEAVIDATQLPPRVVFIRDLSELGKGYSQQLLGSPQ